ncbi:MAG: hypothetical protein LBC68_14545 [Prevotellaceae bacterium]|jgi:hypothetical protein|nr:hypothetical protein [Prevotellaceae bacterium]
MSSKNYPRIYSLSTVGIRNHYNADYRFHPFRTDFAGDSGVGKSIIADILQLIFVGEREFKSATDSSSEREAKKLIVERYGYVFLNIATDTEKYIVIGMYISKTSIDPFIIQANLGLDVFEPLSEPVLSKDFMQGNDIIELQNLPEQMKENKQAYAVKLSLNKYHELLEQNKILPIDLKTEGNLKNFAQIIRAFSRGKGFKNNSKWLKEFFLNDNRENTIMDRFNEQLSDIAQELKDHKENRDTLENVRIKYDKFKRLFDLKQQQDVAQEEYLKTKTIFHYLNKLAAEKNYSQLQNDTKNINRKIANDFFRLFLAKVAEQQVKVDFLKEKLSAFEIAQQDITTYSTKKSIVFRKYPNLEEQYIQVQKVDDLLRVYKTCENLRKAHEKQQSENAEKERLEPLLNDLHRQKLYDKWTKSPWAKSANEGAVFYKKRIDDIDTEIKRLAILKDFSDITNTKSFAYWTIRNKPLLSHEQESVLFNLNLILVEKPVTVEKDIQYIPNPETFFDNLSIGEKENNPNGFWVDWGGIRKFVPYIPERFFITKDSREIINYFKEKYNDAAKIINALSKEKDTLDAMQKLASKHGEDAVNAFVRKDEISAYIIDKNLDISVNQLEELLKVYCNGEDITQTKSELDTAKDLKIKRETEQNQIKREIQQISATKFSNDFSFTEIQSVIKQLQADANALLACKHNRLMRFKQLFSTYLQDVESSGETTVFNIQSKLSDSLREKHSNKKDLKIQKSKIEEESDLYYQTILDYQAHTGQTINIETDKFDDIIIKPEEKKDSFNSAQAAYKQAYNNIVIEYVNEKRRQRFTDSEDYLALTREVVNEIPARQLAANETDALQQMLDFLKQLNDTHIDISNRKLNLLNEIFQDVRDAFNDYVVKINEIGIYFKGSDKQISQGYKLSLTCPFSSIYPISWIDTFLEMLNDTVKQESIYQNVFTALREKIDIYDMMTTAFERCGGFRNVKIEDLLNPKNYFDIKFEMESDDGEKNVGSAGQTYAVTAMLCVARLSLVEKKEKGKQQKGLRFMPIDEAEGIGSNFDLLERIAKAGDYQLISMSINPLDEFREGEQYLYILNGSQRRKERVSTFAIFSNADEIQKI